MGGGGDFGEGILTGIAWGGFGGGEDALGGGGGEGEAAEVFIRLFREQRVDAEGLTVIQCHAGFFEENFPIEKIWNKFRIFFFNKFLNSFSRFFFQDEFENFLHFFNYDMFKLFTK